MKKLSKDEIDKELIEITHQLLVQSGNKFKIEIKLNSTLQHLGIDSLARAELFQRIDKAFNVILPDQLLSSVQTLAEIATYLGQSADTLQPLPKKNKTIIAHHEKIFVEPNHAQSLLDVVLLFAEKVPKQAHIYFQTEQGEEQVITYEELLKSSLRVASGLRERGLREGETVAIMLPTHPTFFYTFLGILFAGGIPVPIYPPFRMHMLEAYAQTEAHILRNAEARMLVTFDQAEKLSLLLKSFVPSLKHVTTVADLMQPKEISNLFQAKPENFAFIQYTSGSTSNPKGVLLTHANLLANVRAYGKRIQLTPDDVAVSWLPLYHDLGLIGMWLGSLYHGIPLILLEPFTFLNRPERWLWAIHYHRGTVSGAPNFAYELCVRKLEAAQLEGLDLSSWRLAANGAEKVYVRTLKEFAHKFGKYGFKSKALMPVYGLAESTVGLAVPPPGREVVIDKVDRSQFESLRLAVKTEDPDGIEFVSCGKPLDGHEIRIVDDENQKLSERKIGGLQFRGPSNMQGYFNNPEATAAIYHDGWLDSGDLAYQVDGEIYITGRRKDLIIKAGRNLYPAEIEEIVGKVPGIREGCVIAFGLTDQQRGTEQLIIVAETRELKTAKREQISIEINDRVATALDVIPDHIVLVKPHTVPKTSSGKLQRAACKKLYVEGKLDKRKLPPWLQIARLSTSSFARYGLNACIKFLKIIYSTYAIFIFGLTVIPFYLLVRFASVTTVAKGARIWAQAVLFLTGCRVRVHERQKLTQASPVIYVANHASYVDALIVLSIMPIHTRYVVKKELFTLPLIKSVVIKMGCLAVDRLDLTKSLEDTKQFATELKAKHSIFIFPEGTFGYASGLRPFRLGAFKIAAETNIPICPIGIIGTRALLREGEWLMQPGEVTITVADIVKPKGSEWQDVIQLRDAVRAEIAKYCGETSLDFIAAEKVAPKKN